MLFKRNLLECITIVSCSGTVICVLLNYLTNISPITGIWFTIYSLTVFILSLIFSFKFIQWLLHLNKPIKYDLDGLVKDYPQLSFLRSVLPQTRKRPKVEEGKEYDTNELSVISTVLERKLVSSWYVPYISQEIGFPFACKQMLDQMIGRTFQICNKIETKDVYVDICSILVSHLKEYRKAIKRHEKSPKDTIPSLYKKSHTIYNVDKSIQSAEHCTNILRVIIKELVSWELWDTPHSELLVRILSKKLDSFIDGTLSDPVWLNDRLMRVLKGEVAKVDEKVEIPGEVNIIEEIEKPEIQQPTIESALSTLITKSTAPILHRAINEDYVEDVSSNIQNIVEEVPINASEPVDIKSSPVLRQRRGRQGRNEVKIYDRIIEGSVKTWESDIDLQCISLGQDLLASLDGEISLSRLWGQDTEPEQRDNKPQPLWFGEEDAIELDLADSPKEPSPVKKELSPKPAELLKDLQTTVSQAKTKIGDLQVTAKIDVPRNRSSDEAAGMMEGLLDFGIAGLKKGLRFTGLSDDSQDKSPSHQKERSGEKISPVEIKVKNIAEPKDMGTTSLIQKEDNGTPTAPPLLKQQRVISQDSVPTQAKAAPESPEPEYEEAADLSTSIAKLRCLLQQREASPSRSEEVWWERAEETRGRTHAHGRHARHVDSATLADEFDVHAERGSPPGQTPNNMQRLDKLLQRTVTGVFNSLRPSAAPEAAQPAAWAYVATSVELSVCGAVARLVGSRRAFSHVDAALDSLQLTASPPPASNPLLPGDLDEWVSALGRGCGGAADVASAMGLTQSHVTHRIATLLCADLAESLIDSWLDELGPWLRQQVFLAFQNMSEQPETVKEKETLRHLDINETVAAILERVPVLHIFGEETLTSAVHLTVSSFSHHDVNKDVAFRLLDLFALQFKKSAALRNPSFDAN